MASVTSEHSLGRGRGTPTAGHSRGSGTTGGWRTGSEEGLSPRGRRQEGVGGGRGASTLMNKDSTLNGALPRPPRHPPPPLPESSKGLGTRLCPFLVPLFLGCCAHAGDQDGPLPGPNSSQWGGGRKEREVSHFEAWKSDPSLLFPAHWPELGHRPPRAEAQGRSRALF